jgi:hypothetical protein
MSMSPIPSDLSAVAAAHEALRHAVAALDLAEGRREPLAMAQALAQVARCYAWLEEPAAAENYIAPAQAWAAACGAIDLQVSILCDGAECACDVAEALREQEGPRAGHSARERARDTAFEAAQLARRVSDPAWEVRVLLRLSDVLNRCGDHDDAAQLQARALRLMAAGQGLGSVHAALT